MTIYMHLTHCCQLLAEHQFCDKIIGDLGLGKRMQKISCLQVCHWIHKRLYLRHLVPNHRNSILAMWKILFFCNDQLSSFLVALYNLSLEISNRQNFMKQRRPGKKYLVCCIFFFDRSSYVVILFSVRGLIFVKIWGTREREEFPLRITNLGARKTKQLPLFLRKLSFLISPFKT